MKLTRSIRAALRHVLHGCPKHVQLSSSWESPRNAYPSMDAFLHYPKSGHYYQPPTRPSSHPVFERFCALEVSCVLVRTVTFMMPLCISSVATIIRTAYLWVCVVYVLFNGTANTIDESRLSPHFALFFLADIPL